jgi:hypothetical protein
MSRRSNYALQLCVSMLNQDLLSLVSMTACGPRSLSVGLCRTPVSRGT